MSVGTQPPHLLLLLCQVSVLSAFFKVLKQKLFLNQLFRSLRFIPVPLVILVFGLLFAIYTGHLFLAFPGYRPD